MEHVAANQTVSYGVYSQAVQNACPFTYDFVKANMHRIARAYKYGEPIWAIVEELKLVHSLQLPAPTKTPRQLAARVVRL